MEEFEKEQKNEGRMKYIISFRHQHQMRAALELLQDKIKVVQINLDYSIIIETEVPRDALKSLPGATIVGIAS